jgi:hypothetical protein
MRAFLDHAPDGLTYSRIPSARVIENTTEAIFARIKTAGSDIAALKRMG